MSAAWCCECRCEVDGDDHEELRQNHNGHMIDCSWNALANPENTPWLPGYRFAVRQDSKNAGRANYHVNTRRYGVYFEIDRDGLLRWTGGVKPTDDTQELVEEMYARGRPGSNYA
jgi:hypothetical protein